MFFFKTAFKNTVIEVCVCVMSCFSHDQPFATPWTHQTPLSMGFSRQESWSGLPCPPPGDFPDTGIEPVPPAASALQVDSLPLSHLGSPAYGGKWPKVGMEEMVMAIVILIQATITKSPHAFFLHMKGRVLRV